jgi:hypothetical protein
MSQLLTPEEMAALFEGLKEAENGPASLSDHAPQEITTRRRIISEPDPIFSFPTLAGWMMMLADLRWPHL